MQGIKQVKFAFSLIMIVVLGLVWVFYLPHQSSAQLVSNNVNKDTFTSNDKGFKLGFESYPADEKSFKSIFTPQILNETYQIMVNNRAASRGFGGSLDIDENTLVIGAEFADDRRGAAYIFVRSGDTWIQQARLLSEGERLPFDHFGQAVAIDGDTIAVGAPGYFLNGDRIVGSVFIFEKNGKVWSQKQEIVPSDGTKGDDFGQTIALEGNTLVIGSHNQAVNSVSSGAVYIFTKVGDTWIEGQKLLSSNPIRDRFGDKLAMDGDTLIIGASGDGDSKTRIGAAHIFTRSNDLWTEQANLRPSDGVSGDVFGTDVDVDGNTAIVGAFQGHVNGIRIGSAYIYERNGVIWEEQAKLFLEDGEFFDFFGFSVGIDGNTAVVGAFGNDDNGTDSGSTHVYTRKGTSWTESYTLFPRNASSGNYFGFEVEIEGGNFFINAPNRRSVFYYNIPDLNTLVTVSGRVFSQDGTGISRAVIRFTDQSGNSKSTLTSQFGDYRFTDIEVGQDIIFDVISREYQFNSQVVTIKADIENLHFTALP